jgi:1-deoxy-D-xylulose-5-phosphate reductoisomerase
MRGVVILGSTGSIGTQAVEVVRRHPDRFRPVGIGAGGGRLDLLARQAVDLGVEAVAVARGDAAGDLCAALRAEIDRRPDGQRRPVPEILIGPDALPRLATHPCDVVLNGVTGSLGLRSTLAALAAGRILALANKESLVAGGHLVKALARPGQIIPVDSEHSAIAQCLRGGRASEVARLVITASGGPFRDRIRAELASVTPAEALAHPTWSMGPVITVNSATLVNKGLELIEAHLLFDLPLDRIDVVVHPQSIVHSMVEFVDGSTIAQASPPDMRLPIALALGWPDRLPGAAAGIDWTTAGAWQFLPLDDNAFPAVRLAREVGTAGGTAPAVYNAANEECVAAFLAGQLSFPGIVDTTARVVAAHPAAATARDVEEVLAADEWARTEARRLIAGPKRILLAKPRGYCAGVDRAVQTVESALERFSAPVYVRKQIVHNTHVVKTLEQRGAVFVDEAAAVPAGATVVFSAHGVAPVVHDEATARNLHVIDATCPLVTKVHREARRFAAENYDILLIGHEGHEEVIGTTGEAPEHIHLVDGPDDVPNVTVRDPDKVVWLSQTTLSVDETARTVEALRTRFPKLIDPPSDDICYATQNRQVSVKEIATRSQLVIVVGSANSSNSVRLVEVALDAGADAAYLVDNCGLIDPRWLVGVTTVGVTSGASVPEELVREVIDWLAQFGFEDVEEVESARETVVFALPRELRTVPAGQR